MLFPFRFLLTKNSTPRKNMHIIPRIFFTFFLLFCAPDKTEVSDQDVLRLIDRVSYLRFSERIDADDPSKIKSDREHFLEACEIYRLNPDMVLEKMKPTYPELYSRFKEKNEK